MADTDSERNSQAQALKQVYFDTSVWMGLYDSSNERCDQQNVESAIRALIELHSAGKIELMTSRQIKEELESLLGISTKAEKARTSLNMLSELNLRELPRTPADCGKAICGEAICGQEPKFTAFPSKPSDRDVAEYLTANGVSFFVSLDERHFVKKRQVEQIEEKLATEGTKVVTPQELMKILA